MKISKLTWIFALAFTLRLSARLIQGEQAFWVQGYDAFFEIASHFVSTGEFRLGNDYAFFPPMYPFILIIAALTSHSFLVIAFIQSLMGAATTFIAALISKELFDEKTGLIAALLVALYPYYVIHDTALQ